jgi:N-acetyltransferase
LWFSETVAAVCGINRIWVHNKHRRRGIASRLVDAARNHVLFDRVLTLSQIAFSQPTQDGRSFGAKYLGSARSCALCRCSSSSHQTALLVYKPKMSST